MGTATSAPTVPPPPRRAVISADALDDLLAALRAAGFRPVGPTVGAGAIVLDELASAADLPHGRGSATAPGSYRLTERGDRAVFGHSAGPQSWKRFLHPARRRLLTADRDPRTGETSLRADAEIPVPYAFVGVRPCDLAAIKILNRALRRAPEGDRGPFIVTVECTEPGAACFCASAGTGPGCADRIGDFDLALLETDDENGHRFLVTVGSERGDAVLDAVPRDPVPDGMLEAARAAVAAAAGRMGRALPPTDLRVLLARSADAGHWADVADRCLACGNCTMVCPTCFCTSVEDTTDLTGDHAERWESWDSCFDIDFSYLHGGSVRTSTRSRYRQWLTHKFGTWHDQFGTSGCVGCGRCVAWCPVGIDVTAELAALDAEAATESGDAR
ncbi:4Fe-4S dicluster domain-containing protein [Catenulispora subtropica]|uniref:4Fe-4S dicluster domain-containing protein n=1 Tax=Catenulispora subtropica TaxID=450798 RepID=A0ABN2TBL7_9ACTN